MEEGTAIQPNTMIGGRYRATELLGAGGFGEVWNAFDERLQRNVAVKVLFAERLAHRTAVARFVDEARAAAAVVHPSIIAVFDIEDSPRGATGPYIVMELLDGHSLHDELRQWGPMEPKRAMHLFLETLEGLGAAHRAGVVHKDLKPGNLVLVRQAGGERLKIVDFGLSNIQRAGALAVRDTAFSGTPRYCAPEYAREHIVTPALDVYQMGLILVEMLTAKPVVPAIDATACIVRHLAGRLDIPDWVRQLDLWPTIERSLAMDPLKRFRDANEFYAALGPDVETTVNLPDVVATWDSPATAPTISADVEMEMAPAEPADLFVGRDAALAQLQQAVQGARFVTVKGPGGAGKSRLAREFARTASQVSLMVSLSAVSAMDGIVARIAESLNVSPELDEIAVALQRTNIVVLDDVERAGAEILPLAEHLLAHCPGLRLLATSRVEVGLAGEHVLALGGLDEPDAVRLLHERAERRGARLDEAADDLLGEIARRLGGMPLALELAAYHLVSASPADVLVRLDAGLEHLEDARSGGLREAFDVSWSLLGEDERLLLGQCSLFVVPFTLDAMRDVVSLGDVDEWQLADVLHGLVRKSVARMVVDRRALRCEIFETIREFAETRLRLDHPEVYVEAVRRHGKLLAATPHLDSSRLDEALVAARRLAPLDPALLVDLTIATEPSLDRATRYGDAEGVLRLTLRACPADDFTARGLLLERLTSNRVRVGRLDEARAAEAEAEAVLSELEPGRPRARVLSAMAFAAMRQEEHDAAVVLLGRAVADLASSGEPETSPSAIATARNLCVARWLAGDLDRALEDLERLIHACDDPIEVARMNTSRWYFRGVLGEPELASASLELTRQTLHDAADTRFTALADERNSELWLHWDHAEARPFLARLREEHGDLAGLRADAPLDLQEGIVRLLDGEPPDAITHLRRVAEGAMDGYTSDTARCLIAMAWLQTGEPVKAVAELERMRVMGRRDPNEDALLALLLGLAHAALGSRGATRQFDNAAELAARRPVSPLPEVIAAAKAGEPWPALPPHDVMLRATIGQSRCFRSIMWTDLLRWTPLCVE